MFWILLGKIDIALLFGLVYYKYKNKREGVKVMKKLIMLILVGVLAVSSFMIQPLTAKATTTSVVVKVGGKVLKITGAQAYMYGSAPMIPLTEVARGLGYTAKSIGTKSVQYKKGSDVVDLTVGQKNAKLNGAVKAFTLAPVLKSGKVFVTYSFIKTLFNTTCDWFSATHTLVVYSKEKGEASVYMRLWQSGEYAVDGGRKYTYGTMLVPKNTLIVLLERKLI